jgi:hypothetical protein
VNVVGQLFMSLLFLPNNLTVTNHFTGYDKVHPSFWGSKEQVLLGHVMAKYIDYKHNPSFLIVQCPFVKTYPKKGSPDDTLLAWAISECRVWCKTYGTRSKDVSSKIGSSLLLNSYKWYYPRWLVTRMIRPILVRGA